MEADLKATLVATETNSAWYRRLLCCYPATEDSRLAVQQLTDFPPSPTSPEAIQPLPHFPIMDYAAERVYLAGRGSSKCFILIHHINLAEDLSLRPFDAKHSHMEQYPKALWKRRLDLFSRFDEGVKLDIESWTDCVWEKIGKCIAKRWKNVKVLDAFCGTGGVAIQLARHCKVLALDLDPLKVEYAKHNANIYGVAEKITFMQGDFLSLGPQLHVDMVMLDLPRTPNPSNGLHETFVNPPLLPVLDMAQRCAPSVLLYLPKEISIDEVAEVISTTTDFPCAAEIEVYHISGSVKGISVIMGAATALPQNDIVRLVASRLNIKDQKETLLLESVISIAGLRKTVELLSKVEALSSTTSSRASLDDHVVSKSAAFFAAAEDDSDITWDRIIRKNSQDSEDSSRSPPSPSLIIRLHRVEDGDETAEILHMLLTYSGLRFVDHKLVIGKYDPTRLQELSEDGVFPVCDYGSKKLVQTKPAARYLAQMFGLYPEDSVQVYLVESMCDYVLDAHKEMLASFNKHDTGKAIIRRFVRRLSRWTGARPSLQDFYVSWFIVYWRSSLPQDLPFPLRRCLESVGK